jgi:hypothetical protein
VRPDLPGGREKWDLYAKMKTFHSRYKIALNVALSKIQKESAGLGRSERKV